MLRWWTINCWINNEKGVRTTDSLDPLHVC
jgi:hypothetical protein